MSERFVALERGRSITIAGVVWTVTHLLGTGRIVAERHGGGAARLFSIQEIADAMRRENPASLPPKIMPTVNLDRIDDDDWETAQRRYTIVEHLYDKKDRSRADIETAAKAAGVGATAVYEWLGRLEDGGGLTSSLVPRKRGRRPGTTLLSADVEALIDEKIDSVFLDEQRHTAAEVVAEVRMACKKAGLDVPAPGSVRARIANKDLREVLIKRGRRDEARNRLNPLRGKFPDQGYPMAVVQIDHTRADLEVVDDEDREPIGRPWITLAIDVYTRMVVGIYVSLDPPSFASAGMCIANAMLPKREYLARLDVPGEWPACGPIGTLHADNAKEFRGEKLRRASKEHHFELTLRPVKMPHYGGHIERMMKTLADEIHKIPGTTFSNPRQRKGYDSGAKASMTPDEFEAYLVDLIVNKYHKKPHTGIGGLLPITKWRLGIEGDEDHPGIGLRPLATSEERLRLDLMPFETRSIQRYGVMIDGICYWDEVLKSHVGKDDAKHLFRFDPNVMNPIHFWDPDAQAYYDIHYANSGRRPASRFEIRRARKHLRDEGRKDFDEDDIFDTMDRLRSRREDAVKKTKETRRTVQRERQAAKRRLKSTRTQPAPSPDDHRRDVPTPPRPSPDLWSKPLTPFGKIGADPSETN